MVRLLSRCLPALLASALTSTSFGNLGAPISEPGLQGRSDIIFFQDFEGSGDAWKQNTQVNKPYITPSSHVAFKGSRSLRTQFAREWNTKSTWGPDAQHYGGAYDLFFARQQLEEPEEIYFRYYLYIPGENEAYPFPDQAVWDPKHWKSGQFGYDPARDGDYRPVEKADKMPGFAGIYARSGWGGAGRGGSYPNGRNGWSARMKAQERSTDSNTWDMLYYVYHMKDGVTGTRDTWKWNASIRRGSWHAIEGYVKLNTIVDPDGDGWGTGGHPNGVLRGWVDGKLAFERTDLVFRYDDRVKIEQIYGNFYMGGYWFPIKDCYIFTDNWVVSSNRIGVYSDDSSDAPSEPEAQPAPEPQPDADRVNIAPESTVVNSSGDAGTAYSAAKALDNNTDAASRWSVSGLPSAQFMEIDLGSVRTIDRTELIAHENRAYQFKVEAKAKASEGYKLIVDRTNNTQGGSIGYPIGNNFDPVQARYVRLTVTGAYDYPGVWSSIVEFRVFENRTSSAASGAFTGTLNLAHFDKIRGTNLDRLYDHARFPDSPDAVEELDQFSYNGSGNNYGLFAWGWLVPATSGDYTFWIASDDEGELMLSTSADPAQTKVIASVAKHSRIDQFDLYPEQKSATVRLEAGRAYYIAAAMKQGWGDANLSVVWEGPGFRRQIIPGRVLNLPGQQEASPATSR